MWKLLVLITFAIGFPVWWCGAQTDQRGSAQANGAQGPSSEEAGTQSGVAATAPALRLQWRAATGGQIRSTPVVGPDGTVYAVSEDGYLYAWDPAGTPQWKRNLGWIPLDCLSVSDDGTIYTGLRNRDLLAVNPRGVLLWRVTLDGLAVGDPALGPDGTVFVGTTAGTLFAISPLGRRAWTITLPGSITQAPVLDGDGTLFLSAADRRLYAYTAWGQFKWSLPLAGSSCSPIVADSGTVVLGSEAGEVIAVSSDGDVLWRHSVGSRVVGVSADSRQIVAATSSGALVGLSNHGEEVWRIESGKDLDAAPFLDGPRIFAVTVDGTLVAAAASQGVTGSLTAATTGHASMDPEGRLFLGGRDWVVYCFGRVGSAAISAGESPQEEPWPQPGHDQRHSNRSQARPRTGNQALLEQLPDYLFLQSLAAAGSHDSDMLLLSQIRARVERGSLGKSAWYVADVLARLAGEGLIHLVYQGNRLVNTYADVRREAASLLGVVGSQRSRSELILLLGAESDPLALAAQIGALGALESDPDGASTRAIAEAFFHHGLYPPDGRLARVTVDALAAIASYRGTWSDPLASETLLSILRGGFSQEVRSAAIAALQNGRN